MDTVLVEYFPFTHDEVPVEKIFDIDGKEFIIEFNYNDRYDFYTLTIKDLDESIIISFKLTYLVNAINVNVDGKILKKIIPFDFTQEDNPIPLYDHVGQENIEQVKVVIV